MINKKQTVKNAIFSVLQVIISGTLLFVVYKYLLLTIGAEKLGVWSIVMAISSISKVSDLGIAGGMVKFVSKHTAKGDSLAVSDIIQTGALSITVLMGFILSAAYIGLQLCAPRIFPANYLGDAVALIPYTLLSFGLQALAGIFILSLDGFQRIDIRNIILTISMVLYVGLIVLLVNKFGFIGLGYAQLAQSIFVLITSWIIVRHFAQIKAIVPFVWRRQRFQEMFAYNMNIQITTIAALLMEPIVKILLGKFGDLSMVTYFEMANKLISQFRGLLVNANQVLVPVIAELQEKQQSNIIALYQQNYTILFFLSITLYSIISIFIPLISEIWIGTHNKIFINFSYIVLIGLFFNTMNAPAFFSNMGVGNVRENTLYQVFMGFFNVVIAVILGFKIGGYGVVIGYSLSMVIGSFFLFKLFFKRYKLSYSALLPKDQRYYCYMSSVISIFFSLYYDFFLENSLLLKSGVIITFLLFLTSLWYINPVSQKVLSRITIKLTKPLV